MTITPQEFYVLRAICDSDFHDGQNPVDNWVWSWSANPWDGTADSRKFAGVLVSLIKKGLAKQDGDGWEACVTITAEGFRVFSAELTKKAESDGDCRENPHAPN